MPKIIEGIKYFKPSDFFCKDGCGLRYADIDEKVVFLADKIRDQLGSPIFIASSLRCPKHNAEVGGERFSYHLAIPGRLKGQALDIRPHDLRELPRLKTLCDILNKDGGVGLLYPGWVHVDTGPRRRW